MLGSLTVGLSVPAAAGDGSWTSLGTPQAGALGSYILAPTTGVLAGPSLLTRAADGTLFAFWSIGEADNLYKSTDSGRTWVRCSTTTDDLGAFVFGFPTPYTILSIVCPAQDAKRVYVLTQEGAATFVYRSIDGGTTFTELLQPYVAGAPQVLTSIDVGYTGGAYYIYATTTGAIPDIITFQDVFPGAWLSTDFQVSFGPGAVPLTIDVSPKFSTEAQPAVVAIFTQGGFVRAGFSYAYGAWSGNPLDNVQIVTGAPTMASVAFPSDFASARTSRDLFVGINGGAAVGGVYRIVASTPIPLNVVGITPNFFDVTSLAAAGNSGACKLIAVGTLRTGGPGYFAYHSEDNGLSWASSQKAFSEITGATPKYVVMDPGYTTNGKAWVSVVGAGFVESSVEQTADYGVSWSDISLIGTQIAQIQNMTASPNYSSDSTVFMLTTGPAGYDSLWKWDGKYWNRNFVTQPALTPPQLFNAATSIVQCSPTFSSDKAVFLVNTLTGTIYRAVDSGTWFKAQFATAPLPIDGAFEVLSATSMMYGNLTNVQISNNNGTSWTGISLPGAAGCTISSFDVAADGKTFLAGCSNGVVDLSADSGATWRQVPAGATVATTTAAVDVAFDSAYATSNMVFATAANHVYSLNVATGTRWSQIDNVPPSPVGAGAINTFNTVPGIQMSKDGTLYVFDKNASGGTAAVTGDQLTIASPTGATGYIFTSAGAATNISSAGILYGDVVTITGGVVAGDAVTITNGAAIDNGTISVTTGAVNITVTGAALVNGAALAVGVAAGGSATWSTTAAAGTVVITATANGTTGSWSQIPAGTARMAVSHDSSVPVNATPVAATAAGPFVLPDFNNNGVITAAPLMSNIVVVAALGATYNTTTGAWTAPNLGTLTIQSNTIGVTGTWTNSAGTAAAAVTRNLSAGATVVAAGGAFAVPGPASGNAVYYQIPATGGTILLTVTIAPFTGTWTYTAGIAVANITFDPDMDSTLTNPTGTGLPGTFRMGDTTTSATTGTSHIVIRSITSARSTFDPLTSGFTTSGGVVANIKGLWYNDASGSPQIWILETSAVASGNRIWTYTDKLTVKPTLTSPANNANTGRQFTGTLVWTALPTATNYEIQVALDNGFRSLLIDAATGNTTYVAANLDDGVTYYWRVRSPNTAFIPLNATVASPGKALSPWSDTWAFTTGIGAAEWNPFVPAANVAPTPGQQGVVLRPTFQWNPADWATGYEFVLSTKSDLSSPLYSFTGASALKTPIFAVDKDLTFSTQYFWSVTAISAASRSNTAYGSFTTMAQPTTAPAGPTLTVPPPVNITIPPAPAPITPAWIWAIVIIGAVLVIAVIVLIVTTRRVP